MGKLNVLDLASIQECLDCYLDLIRGLPVCSRQEDDMRTAREELVQELMRKCEDRIREEAEYEGNNRRR